MPGTIKRNLRAPLAALVLLGGCTSYGHFESRQELSRLYTQLSDAEGRAWETVQTQLVPAAFSRNVEASGDLPIGLPGARLALAQAALNDAQDAVSDATMGAQDKISILYRAALKGWHAGNAWDTDAGFTIDGEPVAGSAYAEFRGRIDAGIELCGSLPDLQRPQRDCIMLLISDPLTRMEVAASNITDLSLEIEGERQRRGKRTPARPDWDYSKMVVALSRQVPTIETAFRALDDFGLTEGGAADPGAPELAAVVSVQRFAYYCHATRAVYLIGKVPGDSGGRASNRTIRNLQSRFQTPVGASLASPDPELVQLFSGNEGLLGDIVGSHDTLRSTVYGDVMRANPLASIDALEPGADLSLLTRRTPCTAFFGENRAVK